jgi:hypothetical protein
MGGSIKDRNREVTVDQETLLWRAMCDDEPEALEKYIAKDATFAFPNGTGDDQETVVYSEDSDPSTKDMIENFKPWMAYKIHKDNLSFVEVDMMSCALTYNVTVFNKDRSEFDAMCTSVWRQGAGGDWTCCAHHMTKLS